MKRTILFFLFCFLLSNANAQFLACLSRDSVLLSTPGYIQKVSSIDSISKKYTEELQQLQKGLEEKYAKLISDNGSFKNESPEQIKQRMSPADTLRFNILLAEDQALQSKAKSYDNMVRFLYEQDVRPILNKVDVVIKSYCEKNKIDMVLYLEQMQPALAYLNPKRNITKEIISLVNNK